MRQRPHPQNYYYSILLELFYFIISYYESPIVPIL